MIQYNSGSRRHSDRECHGSYVFPASETREAYHKRNRKADEKYRKKKQEERKQKKG